MSSFGWLSRSELASVTDVPSCINVLTGPTVRYERIAEMLLAFVTLACAYLLEAGPQVGMARRVG